VQHALLLLREACAHLPKKGGGRSERGWWWRDARQIPTHRRHVPPCCAVRLAGDAAGVVSVGSPHTAVESRPAARGVWPILVCNACAHVGEVRGHSRARAPGSRPVKSSQVKSSARGRGTRARRARAAGWRPVVRGLEPMGISGRAACTDPVASAAQPMGLPQRPPAYGHPSADQPMAISGRAAWTPKLPRTSRRSSAAEQHAGERGLR
jgi:hypothetical protein